VGDALRKSTRSETTGATAAMGGGGDAAGGEIVRSGVVFECSAVPLYTLFTLFIKTIR
jgi:hypothetical protein